MKNITRAALGLLVISSVNQSAAFADDKLTAELLRRVEALEKRASQADKLENENKQLRARLEKTTRSTDKMQGKSSNASNVTPSAYSQYSAASISSAYSGYPKERQWQGIYGGINAGYGQNLIGYTGYDTIFYDPSVYSGGGYANTYNTSSIFSGPVAGAQVGYNYQFANNIVVGGELDLDYADVRDTNTNSIGYGKGIGGLFGATSNVTRYQPSYGSLSGNTQYTRIGMNWLGTARARIGYSLGNFLPYVTGGIAYGELSGVINSANAGSSYGNYSYASFEQGSNSAVQTGWALGAGAEYMVAQSWSIKGEYLYTQLSGLNIKTIGLSADTGSAALYTDAFGASLSTNTFGIHQARIGLNYHTDWLRSNEPVVAKY